MQARIYRYVNGSILKKDEKCDMARPWVVEIDGKIKTNSAMGIIRYGTPKMAELALLEDVNIKLKDKEQSK